MIALHASIALKLVLVEPDSHLARGVWQTWAADGEHAHYVLENPAVRFREPADLYLAAWQFARRFDQPTVYVR